MVTKNSERVRCSLEWQLHELQVSKTTEKANMAEKIRRLEDDRKSFVKDRRQHLLDKAALAEQMSVSRTVGERLDARKAVIRQDRQRLNAVLLHGQKQIDKAIEVQTQSIEDATQVSQLLLFVSFFMLTVCLIR